MDYVVWTGVRFSAPPPNSKTPDLHSIRRSGVIFCPITLRVQVFFFIQFRGIFPYISPYFLANLTNDSPVIRGSGQSINPIAASKSLLHFAMSLDAAAAIPSMSKPPPRDAASSAAEHRLAIPADWATRVPAPFNALSLPGSSSANSDASRRTGTVLKTAFVVVMVYWPFSEKTSRILRGCPVSRQSEGHPPLSSDGSVRHRSITPSLRRSFPGRTLRRFRCVLIRFSHASPLRSLPSMVACRLTISNKIIC